MSSAGVLKNVLLKADQRKDRIIVQQCYELLVVIFPVKGFVKWKLVKRNISLCKISAYYEQNVNFAHIKLQCYLLRSFMMECTIIDLFMVCNETCKQLQWTGQFISCCLPFIIHKQIMPLTAFLYTMLLPEQIVCL